MLEAFIPYVVAPEYTLIEHVPIIKQLKLQVFGPLVATGVILGWHRSLAYARAKRMDEDLFRDYLFWMLVSAFVISHWVSVIFYFPDQIRRDPWVLLYFWNGLSSVGGFFGAFVGMMVYLRKNKQPVMVYADATIYGLLLGWCFGRAGCSLVHDHPGREVAEGTFLAVGPWPDGSWRYDLGLLELLFALTLMLTVYFLVDVHSKRPGWLVGLVASAYAPFRFAVDFLREVERAPGVIETPDSRYAGLTPAQWFTIAFFMAGLWLMFLRKANPRDLEYTRGPEGDGEDSPAEGQGKGSPDAVSTASSEDEEDDEEDEEDEEDRPASGSAREKATTAPD